jgi:ATP-dependent DNA helicase RecG
MSAEGMSFQDLKHLVLHGEDSGLQFKENVRNADSLASEMVAFSNFNGGKIIVGVTDNGVIKGISGSELSRLNQLISNAASQLVRSPISVLTENILVGDDLIVIVITVPKGVDKPYFDKNGVIWLKNGADKRRVNSKEELRRFFQMTGQFHADELPAGVGVDRLDKLRFRDFLQRFYKLEYPDSVDDLLLLLQNMNLATDNGELNLAGVLMFTERPEWIRPQFVVKAIRYPGNKIHVSDYIDTEDFSGPLSGIFADAMAFIMRNLHKVQAGRGVNAPGLPEIPESVFEELLVNALVHRDYMVDAPIRLFIFDNRIEIISPGHLPNNLTVEKIRRGNSNIRNPVLVSYVAKGLLPYHGLGSGIKRALELWPDIDFLDDQDGCLFTVTVHRKKLNMSDKTAEMSEDTEKMSEKTAEMSEEKIVVSDKTDDMSQKTTGVSEKILDLIKVKPDTTILELSAAIGVAERTIERNLQKMRKKGLVRRVGAKKGGYWEIP